MENIQEHPENPEKVRPRRISGGVSFFPAGIEK
jgi:hypothetical protein